jgi:hypothetical protein
MLTWSVWKVMWHDDVSSVEGDVANLVIETNTTHALKINGKDFPLSMIGWI